MESILRFVLFSGLILLAPSCGAYQDGATATSSAASPAPVITQSSATAAPLPSPTMIPSLTATAIPSATPISTSNPVLSAPHLVGYFPSWVSSRNYHVADIPVEQLTHVLYAFNKISDGGECLSGDARADGINFPQLRQLKRQHAKLKTLISIGGYNDSGKFSDVALTAESRLRFAQSCVQFMKQNGFDGIDIDWEFPVSGGLPANARRPQDKQNFTFLLAELRHQLDVSGAADGQRYLLTIAAPAGPSAYANIELGLIHPYLDGINLMTYDFYTGSSPITNFASPLYPASTDPARGDRRRLYNMDAAVQAYLSAGVPAAKLVVGVPFYGRGWKGVPDVNHGLYQPNSGVPRGTWGNDGAFDYRDLKKNYLGAYQHYWHDEAQVPWLYNPTTGIMITYEDAQSLGIKADYVKVKSLGGMMIWQLASDDEQHSLVNTLYTHLQK